MGRFYLTTPIYYGTDAPHVGSAYSTVNADAIARAHRLLGEEVFFLTGTDEHGQKLADTAAAQGITPLELVDGTSAQYRARWAELGIANDDFIRTTEDRHKATVQRFLSTIYERGFITKGTYEGLYCVRCEDYYTDDDLIDGACPIHGTVPVLMAEENYFFRLSAFEDQLLAHYAAHPEAIQPASKRNEALSFIKSGLRDISITRTSIDWGVTVPWDNDHVFYVWYDALVNYLTAVGYGADEERFERWWPSAHHLIGKEILRFHTVWWPAMCMAAGIDPPAQVFVHGWLLFNGKKVSKSAITEGATKLTDISLPALLEDFGADALRYHLLRDTPFGTDGEFSYDAIVSRYNADLANNFGNLAQRVATVVGSKCGGVGPAPSANSALGTLAAEVVADASAAWRAFRPDLALEATWRLIAAANAALEVAEPWKQEPGPEVDAVLGDALEVLRLVCILASPALVERTKELWERIGLDGSPSDRRLDEAGVWGQYPGGLEVSKSDPLFPRRKA